MKLEKQINDNAFLSEAPHFRKSAVLFEESQFSPDSSCNKSVSKVKMTMVLWRNDTDRESINTQCDTYPCVVLSTTSFIRTGSESNSCFYDIRPDTCRKIGNEGEDH